MSSDSLTGFAWSTPLDDAEMFELAPVALLLADYSALKRLFDGWSVAGLGDVAAHLRADPARVALCYRKMRILKANRQAIRLFGSGIYTAMMKELPGAMGSTHFLPDGPHLLSLLDGAGEFSYRTSFETLNGQPIDIRVHGAVLPGHRSDWGRLLIAIEDVSALEQALRQFAAAEQHARGLFERSPVSLWVEDFSEVKKLLDQVRAAGVEDFSRYAARHPEFVLHCMRALIVIDVNQHTVALFGAPDKAAFLSRINDVVPDTMLEEFTAQLADLWDGKLTHQNEVVNHKLDGTPLNLVLEFSVLPGHEQDLGRVLVACTDITARKKAEAHLEFLSRYDVLTGLRNRSFFLEEIARLEVRGPWPVAVLMVDLNGLKAVNDSAGHAAGDEMLRRAGRVLMQATERRCCAARIGGDEFALIVPGTDEAEAARIVARIETLVRRDNEGDRYGTLRLSVGVAGCDGPGCLEATIRRADLQMYEVKRAFYATMPPGVRRVN